MHNIQCTISQATESEIRKEFYVLRNGLIADTLRKGGLKQKYIFGLQLPQIKCVAAKFNSENKSDASALARLLWADKDCREARLLACHIMPVSEISEEEALCWAKDITTREEADILAFRLIRNHSKASEIADKLECSTDELIKYASTAIKRFL